MRLRRRLGLGRAMTITLALGAATLVGCTSAQGPSTTLDQYSRALSDHDYVSAYNLMSESFRNSVSREEYVAMMRDNPGEARRTAEELSGKRSTVEVSAELSYGLGDTLKMVQEGGQWRIAGNPVGFYDHATPRGALRSFLRAYRLERWDVMLRYVPARYRAKMDVEKLKAQFTGPSKAQMELLMNALEANADEPIVERGAFARMPYGERFEVKFVREDGSWMLDDID